PSARHLMLREGDAQTLRDGGRSSRCGIDRDVHGGGAREVRPRFVEHLVLHPEAALANGCDAGTNGNEDADPERTLEVGLGVSERQDLLARRDDCVERRPDVAEQLLERLVAVHEDVGEEDDSGGVRILEAHAALVLRSEEHTSELQSLAYLVCRLLLEKKK